jgi:hypothetical protein
VEDFANRVQPLRNRDKMDVVRHQTVGPNSEKKGSAGHSEQFEVIQPIGIVPKHIRTANAAMGDMMRHSRHDNARDSWHRFI